MKRKRTKTEEEKVSKKNINLYKEHDQMAQALQRVWGLSGRSAVVRRALEDAYTNETGQVPKIYGNGKLVSKGMAYG